MINTELVKQGVAIRCDSLEEAKELFDAMGWDKEQFKYIAKYGFSWQPTFYSFGVCHAWDSMNEEAAQERNHTIIDFADLKQSRLANILGVMDGQCFTFDELETIYYVIDGEIRIKESGFAAQSCVIFPMIKNPEKIKPISNYTNETIESAKAAKLLGFEFVKCYTKGYIELCTNENRGVGKSAYIFPKNGAFEDLDKEKVYKLDDIINQGE